MDNPEPEDLYGKFQVKVENRILEVEPQSQGNAIYYRVCEDDRFLFILHLGDEAEWVAENEDMDPVGEPGMIDQEFAASVGNAIQSLTA